MKNSCEFRANADFCLPVLRVKNQIHPEKEFIGEPWRELVFRVKFSGGRDELPVYPDDYFIRAGV